MKPTESNHRLVWYALACLLAVFVYFYALGSPHIPRNGDEDPYAHITRLTAASGELLPLQSQMDHMRNTKPPLLFWQGIASTGWGKSWTWWDLRYPSVIYTLLTAVMLLMLGRKLSGNLETGFIAALTYLAFFTTYRFGRPFLTNPPEVFWVFMPFFVLLHWKRMFASRFYVPLLFGIGIGIGFLYKSFALGLPVTLGLSGWYLHQRNYRFKECFKNDAPKVAVAITVAVAMFALWFVLDPDPSAVWNEFVVGENVGKFDPHGQSYLSKLLWGGSSIWSLMLAFLTNPGLLTFPVVALFYISYRRRRQLSNDEILLWILIAVVFVSFSLPSQRSGRYLLSVMPAVALLCALNWQQIGRKAFIASLALAVGFIALIAWLALRLQTGITTVQMYPAAFWLLIAGTSTLLLLSIALPVLTRLGTLAVALLVLLCYAAFMRPLDGPLGSFSAEAQGYAKGKTVWVSCNFRAADEGYNFLLPGAEIHGYQENLNFTATELEARYPLFALRVALDDTTGGCAGCKLIGQRLDIRGRISNEEAKEMILGGKVFEHLFVRELLLESPPGNKIAPPLTLAQMCR